ncbi:MAG TPA: carbohydrate ABC transporter permease [Solirubrobacteraceae bacterium]|jgi:sorbitol/mannitol transport system permease protein|nr:carbohydrate ABC transporter permease [Solirubrobacteraceae bacterium]
MATVAADARTQRAGRPRSRIRQRVTGVAWGTVAWFLTIIFFFPVFWMILTSFKPESAAYSNPPQFAFHPTLSEYKQVFSAGMGPFLANSAIATVISVLLVLALATPAAYALSMRPIAHWRDALFFFISTKMLPVVAAIVPIYLAVRDIGMLDSIPTLIVLYTAMNLPIAVWMMRSFFLEVPGEILEAARIDGADVRRELTEVVLPTVAPGLAATALICAIFAWNEFFFALNLTSIRAATMPVFLVGFVTSEGLYWAKLAAAATLASVPVLIAGWIAQRQLVRGLSMGAIK